MCVQSTMGPFSFSSLFILREAHSHVWGGLEVTIIQGRTEASTNSWSNLEMKVDFCLHGSNVSS